MNILVTGGSGFIGSHTCLILLEAGFHIIVLDSLVNSSNQSLKRLSKLVDKQIYNNNINIINGDIRDQLLVKNIFINERKKNKPIEAVIHFAGLKSVGESSKFPLKYWDANVIGMINLLNIMQENNCKKIVFSSSATIYGKSKSGIITEDSSIAPINPYGETKATIEKILIDLSKSDSEWRVANLRYFNPAGAHNSGIIGEDPLGTPSNIFPIINLVASGKLKELTIFGGEWPTPDGTCIRDYIHVMDLAESHLHALFYLFEKGINVLNINIGTGIGTSVLELIKTFEYVNNVNINYKFGIIREGDVPITIADNSLALSTLNLNPKRSIEDMCIDSWNWTCKNPHGYNLNN